jgi:hypothetical protein
VLYPKTRDAIARLGIGFAFLVGGLGLVISFVPGAEVGWFGVAAGAAALGLLSPSWRVRTTAVVLTAACAWFARLGYLNGLLYQEWLRQHGLA